VNRIHGSSYDYNYEKIGHGWVQKLVDRHLVPIVDGDELAKKLNEKCQGAWKSGGASGLVAICRTTQEEQMDPAELVGLLSELDEGCS
jgi:hypothetical protein